MKTQQKAAWIFGSILGLFVLGVFAFGQPTLPSYKQQILAFICAIIAGLFATFFSGALLVNAELPLPGKFAVQGGAGFGLFLVVLFWWNSSASPIKATPNPPPPLPPSVAPTTEDGLPATKPGFQSQKNAQPTLEKMTITFIVGDDDKDHDTTVAVALEKGGTQIAAVRNLGDGETFRDNTTHGPFDVKVVKAIHPSEVGGCVTRLAILTNGNDTWHSHADITLAFSDGSEKHQSINFVLSESHREQAWDW